MGRHDSRTRVHQSTPVSTYKAQKRGGKGNKGMEARDDDFVNQLFIASTAQLRLFFSSRGKGVRRRFTKSRKPRANAKGQRDR